MTGLRTTVLRFSRAPLLAALAAALLSTAACTNEPVPDSAPSIVGTLTRVAGDRLLIEEAPSDSSGSAKASVRVISGTEVHRRNGGRMAAAGLRVGQRVSAWFSGPVMESYPVQATAATIVVEADSAVP
jgi:hypothetical protein